MAEFESNAVIMLGFVVICVAAVMIFILGILVGATIW